VELPAIPGIQCEAAACDVTATGPAVVQAPQNLYNLAVDGTRAREVTLDIYARDRTV
jgi:hypothetical protein